MPNGLLSQSNLLIAVFPFLCSYYHVLNDLFSRTLYLKLSHLSLPFVHPCNPFFLFFFKLNCYLVERSQKELKDPGDVVLYV